MITDKLQEDDKKRGPGFASRFTLRTWPEEIIAVSLKFYGSNSQMFNASIIAVRDLFTQIVFVDLLSVVRILRIGSSFQEISRGKVFHCYREIAACQLCCYYTTLGCLVDHLPRNSVPFRQRNSNDRAGFALRLLVLCFTYEFDVVFYQCFVLDKSLSIIIK